jgi:hypothetical protein
MIVQGREGCLVLFWNDKLMFGLPLGYNKYDDYVKQANDLIIDSLEKGCNIPTQIHVYKTLCESVYKRKMKGNKISTFDIQMFSSSVLSLIKFKVIDEDDCLFIAPRKKGKFKIFNQR